MSKSKKEDQVNITLLSLREQSYSFDLPEKVKTEFEQSRLQFKFGLRINITQYKDNILSLLCSVAYEYEGCEKALLECTVRLQFLIEPIERVIILSNKKEPQIEDDFLPRIYGFGIGTLRGVVMSKTVGTVLQDSPIPLFDPREALIVMGFESVDKV